MRSLGFSCLPKVSVGAHLSEVMRELAWIHPERVADVFAERLAFERASLKLYQRICGIMKRTVYPPISRLVDTMLEHKEQEREHQKYLEEQIRQLGGDPGLPTEMSKLALAETRGIEEVVTREGDLRHLFHALLAAELVDTAGWDLLVQLADEAGDRQAKRELKRRLHEEEEHLAFMRHAVEQISIRRIFGEPTGLAPF